ncbi:MAG: folylpolyglutamate synthase/dihydrofolate synthase family protein [Hyphomonadaceae bacterium]
MMRWQAPFPKFGEGPCLERLPRVARALDVELGAFGAAGAVLVGSNGKGSTAAMNAAILTQAGARVGLFTSPHLFALNERFAISGEPISDAALARHWARVEAAVDAAGEREKLGAFEFLFLIAADWFASERCTHTIWEAGLGGRLDPVRLIEAKRVALTSLDLEHTDLLGDTLEAIAREKLDAAPAGARVFVADSCAPVREPILAHAAARNLLVEFVAARAEAGALAGDHQRANAALATALARDMADVDEAAIGAGLAATRWPGRLEALSEAPLVVIDVGHTPAALAAALAGFHSMRGDRESVLVCGVSADKDAAAMIGALAPSFRRVVCTAAAHRGLAAGAVAALAAAAHPDAEIAIAENVADARRIALAQAGPGGAVYVAGGLFLAAEFRALHLGRDPGALAFF